MFLHFNFNAQEECNVMGFTMYIMHETHAEQCNPDIYPCLTNQPKYISKHVYLAGSDSVVQLGVTFVLSVS